ncbi:MAG: hypothetical protein R2751_01090 [Bacteroidales bacterium]
MLSLMLLSGLPAVVLAQPSAQIDLSASYDDNVFLSPQKIGDFIYDTDLTLGYTFGDTATSVYYSANGLLYQYNPVRNLLLNKIGISHNREFGATGQHWLYLGANAEDRRNTETFNYYNYQQGYAYVNLRLNLNGTFLRLGVNARYRNYPSIPELTNFQEYLFLQLSRSFQTRTTLMMESNLGFKSFQAVETWVPVSVGINGNERYMLVEERIPGMSQLALTFRVAQSLHDRVGLYVQYSGQYVLNDTGRTNSTDYFQDEELFDDPFSYRSSGLSSRLTIILPGNLSILAGGGYTTKHYVSETSYLSAEDAVGEGDLREDQRWNAYLKLSKTFLLKTPWMNAIKPYLSYSYLNNASNSYWYEYNYNYVNLGILFDF